MARPTHRTAPGFTYFVTTKTWENRAIFQVAEAAKVLIQCMIHYRDAGSYQLHEFVVMPDHLHLLLTPAGNPSLERAMQLIKGGSSHQIHQQPGRKIQIWSPGFHEESIRDHRDYRYKIEYIHMNPVRAHLAEKPEDWSHSSAAGGFRLDAEPERLRISSGAKAPFSASGNVGAKAPTP